MTVYGLIRVSTTHQANDGLSLEQQRSEILAYADRHGLEQPRILVEEGVSGFKTESRSVFNGLMDTMNKPGAVSVVIVYDLSRLSRRAKDVLSFIDLARERGVRFVSLKEAIDSSTTAGKTVLGILAVVNEMLRHQAVERTKAALDHLKDKGMKTGGTVPFGFDAVRVEDGIMLVPSRAEYEVIVLVNRLRGEGMSLRAIARALDERGIRSKTGRSWHASTVRGLLRRTAEDDGVQLSTNAND
jgi:site-specific DNA recombinase